MPAMPSPSSLPMLLKLLPGGILSGGLLCAGLFAPPPALAQVNRQPYGSSLGRQAATDYTVLHVNPLSGDDQFGDGTQYQPFKTITQALQIAQPGTVILLAPGRYTRDNGESFPLQLRPGISLQGQPTTTQSVLIQGGGSFTSPALSAQNAAVVMADRSGLAYVVVSNPTPQGHGVWIEAGQPVIRNSALVASEHTGLYVAGGAPTIEGSYFSQNRVAGLVLYGSAQALVQSNIFEDTGAAITVSDGAYAEITNNRIFRNDEGLVLLGNASPLIADNQITQNRRNGVVEGAMVTEAAPPQVRTRRAATAGPAASTPTASADTSAVSAAPAPSSASPLSASRSTEPESPAVSAAMRPSTPRQAAPSVRSAPVETLSAAPMAETAAPVPDIAATTPTDVEPPTVAAPIPEVTSAAPLPAPAASEPAASLESEAPASSAQPSASPGSPSIAELRNRVRRREAILSTLSAETDRAADSGPQVTTSSIPVTPTASAIGSGSVDIAVIPAASSSRREIAAPVPRSSSTASRRPTSTSAARGVAPNRAIPRSDNPGNRLAVPGGNIPVGSGGATQFSPPANGVSGPPAPPSRASALGLTYRVFVDPNSETDRDHIRQIVPDAFRTQLDGQPLMQVGAYADAATAEARQQLLRDHGFDARIEYLP